MYEKQTVRLNYCEIHEQISSKTKWIQVKLFLKNKMKNRK